MINLERSYNLLFLKYALSFKCIEAEILKFITYIYSHSTKGLNRVVVNTSNEINFEKKQPRSYFNRQPECNRPNTFTKTVNKKKRPLLFPPDQIGGSRRSSPRYERWSSVPELKRTPHHSLLLQCNHRGMGRLPRAASSSYNRTLVESAAAFHCIRSHQIAIRSEEIRVSRLSRVTTTEGRNRRSA